jgi:hypothetical protein
MDSILIELVNGARIEAKNVRMCSVDDGVMTFIAEGAEGSNGSREDWAVPVTAILYCVITECKEA